MELGRPLGGGVASNSRTGGKGSVRRKRKATHKNSTNDDKKLQSVLKVSKRIEDPCGNARALACVCRASAQTRDFP